MTATPHGPGFSFLDRLDIVEPNKRARGVKWLNPDSAFFADHFPGQPLMPGVLLIECAAQAAGAFWAQMTNRPPTTPVYLAGVQQFRFMKTVLPGQTVEVTVSLEKDFGSLAAFEAVVEVDQTVVAQGKLTMSRAAT